MFSKSRGGSKAILRDWSLITGKGGATKWENRCTEMPLPQDWVKLLGPPPPLLKGGNYLRPPPPSEWLKSTPKPFGLHPSSPWLKHFPAPPPSFRRGKSSRAPALPFCSPPLPVISDQSLSFSNLCCHPVLPTGSSKDG